MHVYRPCFFEYRAVLLDELNWGSGHIWQWESVEVLPGFTHPKIDQRRVKEPAPNQQNLKAAYQGEYARELSPCTSIYLPNLADSVNLATAASWLLSWGSQCFEKLVQIFNSDFRSQSAVHRNYFSDNRKWLANVWQSDLGIEDPPSLKSICQGPTAQQWDYSLLIDPWHWQTVPQLNHNVLHTTKGQFCCRNLETIRLGERWGQSIRSKILLALHRSLLRIWTPAHKSKQRSDITVHSDERLCQVPESTYRDLVSQLLGLLLWHHYRLYQQSQAVRAHFHSIPRSQPTAFDSFAKATQHPIRVYRAWGDRRAGSFRARDRSGQL